MVRLCPPNPCAPGETCGCPRLGLTVLGIADLSQRLGVKGHPSGTATAAFPVLRLAPSTQRGEGNLNARTSDREDDDKQGSQAKDEDSAASSADRAKEREREMEESGEENAA